MEMIDTIYNYAKFQFDCGNYEVAGEYLGFYRMLVASSDKVGEIDRWMNHGHACSYAMARGAPDLEFYGPAGPSLFVCKCMALKILILVGLGWVTKEYFFFFFENIGIFGSAAD